MENEFWREKHFPDVKLAFFSKTWYPAASPWSIADSTGLAHLCFLLHAEDWESQTPSPVPDPKPEHLGQVESVRAFSKHQECPACPSPDSKVSCYLFVLAEIWDDMEIVILMLKKKAGLKNTQKLAGFILGWKYIWQESRK